MCHSDCPDHWHCGQKYAAYIQNPDYAVDASGGLHISDALNFFAGAVTVARRCGWLGLLPQGHDGHGGGRRLPHHCNLLGLAAHSRATCQGWPAKEEEAEDEAGNGRQLQGLGIQEIHQRSGGTRESSSLSSHAL